MRNLFNLVAHGIDAVTFSYVNAFDRLTTEAALTAAREAAREAVVAFHESSLSEAYKRAAQLEGEISSRVDKIKKAIAAGAEEGFKTVIAKTMDDSAAA